MANKNNKRFSTPAPVAATPAPVVEQKPKTKDHVPSQPGESKAASVKTAWRRSGKQEPLKVFARRYGNGNAWLKNKAADPHKPPQHKGRSRGKKSK